MTDGKTKTETTFSHRSWWSNVFISA